MSEVDKRCQMVPKDDKKAKRCQKLPKVAEKCRKLPKTPKYDKMIKVAISCESR